MTHASVIWTVNSGTDRVEYLAGPVFFSVKMSKRISTHLLTVLIICDIYVLYKKYNTGICPDEEVSL